MTEERGRRSRRGAIDPAETRQGSLRPLTSSRRVDGKIFESDKDESLPASVTSPVGRQEQTQDGNPEREPLSRRADHLTFEDK